MKIFQIAKNIIFDIFVYGLLCGAIYVVTLWIRTEVPYTVILIIALTLLRILLF